LHLVGYFHNCSTMHGFMNVKFSSDSVSAVARDRKFALVTWLWLFFINIKRPESGSLQGNNKLERRLDARNCVWEIPVFRFLLAVIKTEGTLERWKRFQRSAFVSAHRIPSEETNLPPYTPPPPHFPNAQEGLCHTELLQALLDVKLHIMRVSEVLCEPDTFENLRALPGIRFLCCRAPFFTELLWKLIYESTAANNRIKTWRVLFVSCEVCECECMWSFDAFCSRIWYGLKIQVVCDVASYHLVNCRGVLELTFLRNVDNFTT
jgi:hypothetical protein